MKPITDLIGNQLEQNDLVAIKIGGEILLGRVAHVSPGGLALAGTDQPTPPMISIALNPYNIVCAPDNMGRINTNIKVVYKLVDPAPKDKLPLM